jgi:ribosomal protein S18 acetylase RimI-like enzyme
VSELLLERWASTSIVSRGSSHDAAALPGFVAEVDGERAGLLIYEETERQVEVVTLDALRESIGVGTALLGAVVGLAGQHRCKRVWLVTTNDNLHALRFYQRRGFRLVAVHAGAVDKARALKPAIPTNGLNGIAIHDEIELACPMDQVFDNDRRQPA